MKDKKRSGNPEWSALSDDPFKEDKNLPPLQEGDVTLDNITLLLAHLINDSKYNVARQHSLYYESSKEFLMNETGTLEYWLKLVYDVDLEKSLRRLKDFVFNGSVDKLAYMRRMV